MSTPSQAFSNSLHPSRKGCSKFVAGLGVIMSRPHLYPLPLDKSRRMGNVTPSHLSIPTTIKPPTKNLAFPRPNEQGWAREGFGGAAFGASLARRQGDATGMQDPA